MAHRNLNYEYFKNPLKLKLRALLFTFCSLLLSPKKSQTRSLHPVQACRQWPPFTNVPRSHLHEGSTKEPGQAFIKKIIFNFFNFLQAFTISSLLLADSVAIIRYVMIFSLKNPAAINDHFWKVFINIWVYTFAFVTQIIYVMSPGHWNVNFYVCSGMQPFQVL